MNQNIRLNILQLTCFISFLIYWMTFVLTSVYAHCWSFNEFWFETKISVPPLTWFLLLFSLIAIWWLLELLIFISKKKIGVYSISQLSIIAVFLAGMSIVFYNFGLYKKWANGEVGPESFIFDSEYTQPDERETIKHALQNKNGLIVNVPKFSYQHWLDFRDMKTCKKGIDFNTLTQKQWSALYDDYEQLQREAYNEIGLNYDDPTKYSRQKKPLNERLF